MRLSLVNLKGGAGKTTSAVFLAGELARRGRTLLVDADPQGSTMAWSNEASAFPVTTVSLPVSDMHRRLAELGRGFDHVVIDTPPGSPGIVRSAVLASDVVVVPIPPTYIDLNRLRPTMELLAELEPIHQATVRVLLTRVRARTRAGRGAREALVDLGVPVLENEIPLREVFAISFGEAPEPDTEYARVLGELLRQEVPV